MTQEKITLLRSQNWYPAFRANEISQNRVYIPEFFTCLHEYLNFAFYWVRTPQGDSYWRRVYKKLVEQGL